MNTSYDGTIIAAPSVDVGAVLFGDASFMVPDGATSASLNLTVSLTPTVDIMFVASPQGCQSNACHHDEYTRGATATFEVPLSQGHGKWWLNFFGNPAPTQGSFHATLSAWVPA
ncbi:MAG: hypothetical protein ACYDBQ_09265 [Thermoplasmatota archaeon]